MSAIGKASMRATAVGFALGAIGWGFLGSRLINPADYAGALTILTEIDEHGQKIAIHDPRRAGMLIALVVFSILGGVSTAWLVRQRRVLAWMPTYITIGVTGSLLSSVVWMSGWDEKATASTPIGFLFGMLAGLLGVIVASRLFRQAR